MKIPIVNEQDEIIGYKENHTKNAHEISRVSALWIEDFDGNVLLAQRGLNKKYHPGCWAAAVVGTVEEGETYESNIIKEAIEEIGLFNIKPILAHKNRVSSLHEYFCQWFICKIDKNYSFKKRDEEVEAIKWFSKKEIEKLLEEKPDMFIDHFKKYFTYFNK